MTPLPLGDAWLAIEGVVEVASGRRTVRLSREPAFRERIARGALFLKQTLDQGGSVYGVNTGYGDSCVVAIPPLGASGDLTPLSYVAPALIGEREVSYRGSVRPAAEVLREVGLAPLELAPKEGLAIMNGTAVMTGLACLAWSRAEYLSRFAARLSAMAARRR